MARLPRFVLPGQPQHVIQRGNNREAIFAAEADYRFYLEKLRLAAAKHYCDIHAYVLMTNHAHLLLTPQEKNGISKTMQAVGRCYVQYFNYRYRRTGTLWEGRYRATLVDSECYLLTCMRYIELNPVRANLVSQPANYPWSSYRHNALGQPDALVTAHRVYCHLGQADRARQFAYSQLFKTQLDDKTLADIRESTNKAWALGDKRFRRTIATQLERRSAPCARGGDHKSRAYQKRKINRV